MKFIFIIFPVTRKEVSVQVLISSKKFHSHSNIQITFSELDISDREESAGGVLINAAFTSGIDEILDLEKISRGNGPLFLSRPGELNFH